VTQCWKLLPLALLSACIAFPAIAQTPLGNRSAGLFAEFSMANPGQSQGWNSGGSAGAYFQGHLLGWSLRGLAEPTGVNTHVYQATFGPRIAINLPFFKPFIEVGGGAGHASYPSGYGAFGRSWGAAWQANVGIEHELLPMMRWRILELGYGHIYAGPGVSPLIASSGLCLNF